MTYGKARQISEKSRASIRVVPTWQLRACGGPPGSANFGATASKLRAPAHDQGASAWQGVPVFALFVATGELDESKLVYQST